LATPSDRQTAPHYRWGNDCDGWRLLEGEELCVTEERMPPRASEVPHYHTRATQFFYVLRGALSIDMGEHQHVLNEGQGLVVRPGEVHTVCNRSNEDVEFLLISSPDTSGDRVLVTLR
jgi:mannose-6-phosphate isomerase-like protein (cupin superfamily)